MAQVVLIGLGGEGRVEGVLLGQDVQVLLLDGDDLDLAAEGELGHVGVGVAGAEEHTVEGTVLHAVLGGGLVGKLLVDIVIAHAVSAQDLTGGDLVAGAHSAHADLLAGHVSHGSDAAVLADNDLHHLGVAGGDGLEVGDGGAVEQLDALVGIAEHVRLDHGELVLTGAQQTGVLGGAAGGVHGDVGAGDLVDDGADGVAEVVVVAGGGAGAHQVAALEAGLAGGALSGSSGLGLGLAAGGERQDHHECKQKSEKSFHFVLSMYCTSLYLASILLAIGPEVNASFFGNGKRIDFPGGSW